MFSSSVSGMGIHTRPSKHTKEKLRWIVLCYKQCIGSREKCYELVPRTASYQELMVCDQANNICRATCVALSRRADFMKLRKMHLTQSVQKVLQAKLMLRKS